MDAPPDHSNSRRLDLQAELLTRIPELLNLALILTDAEGTVLYLNMRAEELCGCNRVQAVGHGVRSIFVPQISADEAAVISSRLQAGERWTGQYPVQRCDGGVFLASITKTPICDEQGHIVAILRSFEDVTERIQVEEAVRDERRLLQSVLDTSPSGIVSFRAVRNANGAIVDFQWCSANVAAERMVGRTPGDLVGRRMLEELPGTKEEGLFDLYARAVETGKPLDFEHYYGHEGISAWFHAVVAKMDDGLVVTFSDITERKHAEEALRESEARLRLALDNSKVIVTEQDVAMRYTRIFNPSPDLAVEEVLGKTDQEILPAEDSAAITRIKEQVLQTGAPARAEVRTSLGGHLLYHNIAVEPLRDAAGGITGITCASMDVTDHKLAEERIRAQLERLAALRAVDQAIIGSTDVNLTLSIVMDQVMANLRADAGLILRLDQHDQTLRYAVGRGFREKAIEKVALRMGDGFGGRVALERRPIYVTGSSETEQQSTEAPLLAGEDIISFYGVPLIAKGSVHGVLEVFLRTPPPLDPEEVDFLEALSGQAAIAIENASLFEGLQRGNSELIVAYEATLEGWSRALDLRDRETEGHSQRVTEMTVRLARLFGMSGAELTQVRRGALLHDIGKLGIPDAILLKPGPLTAEEWKVMKRHPEYAFEWLSPITYLRPALEIPYCHHEKWDGTGYPRGLKGEQIPLAARLFAIVDVWDALQSDRPYRKAWNQAETIRHIESLQGTHFDPQVVEVFMSLVNENPDPA